MQILCFLNLDLNFEQQFDVITMWHLLEHLSDPAAALFHAKKCLKPGGYMIIEVPNIHSLKFLLSSDQNRWIGGNHPRYHRHFFSYKTLKRLLTKTGFSQVNQLPLTYVISNFSWLKKRTKRVFNRIHLDSFITVIASE